MTGKVHSMNGPGLMPLRIHVGTGSNGTVEFEMSNSPTGCPIVECKATGKWWCMSWDDIVTLADEAGLLMPDQRDASKSSKKKGRRKP